jgi:hypothetical protein
MAIKRYKPEQIVTLLRQIEVGIANGKPTLNEAEITVQTYYRWSKEYGGLNLEQAKQAALIPSNHGVDRRGDTVLRRRLRRSQVAEFFRQQTQNRNSMASHFSRGRL